MRYIMILAGVVGAFFFIQRPASACVQPPYDVGAPPQDLGYDAQESPADPVVASSGIYDHTIDDGALFGCGGASDCDGVRTRLTLLEIQEDSDIDRVRVEYEDGTVVYGTWSTAPEREGMVEVPLSFGVAAPFNVQVSLFDVDGYESNRVTVTVGGQAQALAPRRRGGRNALLLGLALCGLVATEVRRRRV